MPACHRRRPPSRVPIEQIAQRRGNWRRQDPVAFVCQDAEPGGGRRCHLTADQQQAVIRHHAEPTVLDFDPERGRYQNHGHHHGN
ncbi:hypothetical protein Pden_0256 [Paracoccus denitrificans PD1222]|uniref:Uncharacterized protein n=1 Tax=Paracoccus denitrificans (strain Pd 1222) TaxID=318586 RepID=A1AYM6_PARDP|nr:hypothetical protein Pden_0256 [Paracoccus denitrificans PD1222]